MQPATMTEQKVMHPLCSKSRCKSGYLTFTRLIWLRRVAGLKIGIACGTVQTRNGISKHARWIRICLPANSKSLERSAERGDVGSRCEFPNPVDIPHFLSKKSSADAVRHFASENASEVAQSRRWVTSNCERDGKTFIGDYDQNFWLGIANSNISNNRV